MNRAYGRCVLATVLGAALAVPDFSIGGERTRLALPAGLDCPRDLSTSYSGEVLEYARQNGRLLIGLRKDGDALERFELRMTSGSSEPVFTLGGDLKRDLDWRRVETADGGVLPGTSAIVWVCRDRDRVMRIDFYPSDTPLGD